MIRLISPMKNSLIYTLVLTITLKNNSYLWLTIPTMSNLNHNTKKVNALNPLKLWTWKLKEECLQSNHKEDVDHASFLPQLLLWKVTSKLKMEELMSFYKNNSP